MSIAARRPALAGWKPTMPVSLTPVSLPTPAPSRWMTVVGETPADHGPGGIWTDELFAAEAGELTALLGGLARLEAEILSL